MKLPRARGQHPGDGSIPRHMLEKVSSRKCRHHVSLPVSASLRNCLTIGRLVYLTISRTPLMEPLRPSSFHLPSSLSPVTVTSKVYLSPSISSSPVSVSPVIFRLVNSNWPSSLSADPVSLPS